jgi:hypothetical protein
MCAFYQLMSIMRRLLLLNFCLFFLCLFCQATFSDAAVPDGSLNQTAIESTMLSVLQQAEDLKLAQHDIWFALLHYKRETVLSRFISQADDKRFFLDENGNSDASAELDASIKAFLSRPDSSLKSVHAQCLFPARWWWLKQQLNLSNEYDVTCPKLQAFMAGISHDKLFLVFPSMYLNNPGSTFGHTFLRFDNHNESILLSQTLNYAARVDKSDDFVSYISKGLSGGYTGFFRARPYYETVQEYNNIENRDIWEYQLAFTKDEIEQLVRHVWEVKGIDFDYYFFRENCAYRLLALLDVIRPGMQLTAEDDFPVYAIPVDTVRVLDTAGLIQSRKFRASLATQINDSFAAENNNSAVVLNMVSEETPGDKDILSNKLQVLSIETEKLEALQQSYNILQFNGESSSPKAQQILQLINELPPSLSSSEKTVIPSRKISAEKGHDSIRVAAGYGEQNNRQYIDLRFRPAFHDLLDSPQGYVDGAAINIFDVRFKWFANNDFGDNFKLESLSLFNVTSLSPLRQWQKPVSWLFDFRFDRTQISESQSVRNFISRGGVGVSIRQQALMPFVLLMGEWNLSSSYAKGYSLLFGLQAGLHFTHQTSQFMLSYEKDNAVSGFELDKTIGQLQWQYNLHVNHAVRLLYKRIEYDFFNDKDWSLSYNYYF